MRIDVFFDAFPHPAKPNMETQLLEWQRQGHTLRLYSMGRIGTAVSAFPVTFIRTLRQAPVRLLSRVLWRALTHPDHTRRIARCERSFVGKIKLVATDAQMAIDAPDAYFIHNLAAAVRFSYLKHARTDVPLAIYYHGGELPGVPQISPEDSRAALQRADIVFSNTQASINEAVKRGAPPERVACAPTAFPLERFPFSPDRPYLPGRQWRFVCVGRMAPEKGFDVALHAFAALRQHAKNFHVTLIGDGPELSRLKALALQLQATDFVQFRGHVDSAELIPLLGQFDVFVLSSRPVPGSNWTETQGAVMQEAMLMGTIVIASDIGGVRESLPPALQHYLYPPGSADELLGRLLRIIRCDETSLRVLSAEARRFTQQHYDIRQVNTYILDRIASLRTPRDDSSARELAPGDS